MRVLLLAAIVGCGHALSVATAVSLSPRRTPAVLMRDSGMVERFAVWHPDCEAALNKQACQRMHTCIGTPCP
jgi:hypothetical protein